VLTPLCSSLWKGKLKKSHLWTAWTAFYCRIQVPKNNGETLAKSSLFWRNSVDAIPVLWHSERRAPGHKDRFVSAAERQLTVEMTPHKDHLLVTKPEY
jgi:hypothetical protein